MYYLIAAIPAIIAGIGWGRRRFVGLTVGLIVYMMVLLSAPIVELMDPPAAEQGATTAPQGLFVFPTREPAAEQGATVPPQIPALTIEAAPEGIWFHRVYDEKAFVPPHWGGADSFYVQLYLGPSNGRWTSFGNPGQIIFRGGREVKWMLGVRTDAKYKEYETSLNIRIAPHSPVTVVTPHGVITQETSDAGDLTILLPVDNVIWVHVDYVTHAPHESIVWWGPHDRPDKDINILDAR